MALASFFETENDNEMDRDSPEVLEQVIPERSAPEPQSRPSGNKKSKSKSKSYSK